MTNLTPSHRLIGLLVLFVIAPQTALAANSLVRDGDRWVCLGDSITAEDIYPRILARVFAHYHPEAKLTVINSGQGGDTAGDNPQKLADRVLKHRPTIVSVMYGMNEAINVWHAGQPQEPVWKRYRQSLTYIARTLRERGVTVLLMSPTLTDPTCGWSFFDLEGTVPFLRECAGIVRDVAKKEGAIYIPAQEDLEALQQSVPPGVTLQSDGVHVSALGQYRMARSLWELAHFAALLGDRRRAVEPPVVVPDAALVLTSRFLDPTATGLNLTIRASRAATVAVTWSLGDLRRQETLQLRAGDNRWTPAIPADRLPARNGQNADLLVDLREGDARRLYIIDLCRTRVLHFRNDIIRGVVESDQNRPEGKRVANWQLRRVGSGLLFSGEVFDSEIKNNGTWPFGRDGFNLMFDFRPAELFAGISVDREVHQTLLNVYEKPFFAIGLRAWSGAHMGYAAVASGAKTPTGYTTQLFISENFTLHNPVNLAARDFIGLLVGVGDADSKPGDPRSNILHIISSQRNDYGVNLYANNLMVIDLKNKLRVDSVINVHAYPANH
jgi:lysophospholipase L1-like esterase